MITPTVQRLLPNSTALPVWRREGIRTLEAHLQAISPRPLMDMAGLTTTQLALAVAPHARNVWVLAGPGNNGGDGLEAALHLQRRGLRVQVNLLANPEQLPPGAHRAFERARQAGVPIQTGLPTDAPPLREQDLCIDALLGIGATRAPEGLLLQAVQAINRCRSKVLAIDIPSGLDADSGQWLGSADTAVQATHTLTMLGAKPGLFMGHGRDACGALWLAPLGLTEFASGGCPPDAELNPPANQSKRLHGSHKGSHGDVAVVGGESAAEGSSMVGAAVLASHAALCGGAGRVMLSLLGAQTSSLPPDVMRRSLNALDLPCLTVVAGCGGGQAIASVMGRLLLQSSCLVLDADALNRLAEDPWLQRLLSQRAQKGQTTVLTPHPLEAARLLACSTAQVQADRLEAAVQLAQRFNCVVALKGSGTVLTAPGHTPRINSTGNGLLATGGTGDVLAGLVGAKLATSGDAWHAACTAVWTHGQLADTWPDKEALTASRLARRLAAH